MPRISAILLGLLILMGVGVAAVLVTYLHYSQSLPEYKQLADYRPPMVTRIHAGDGRMLAEFAVEKRVFVPIEAFPKRVIQAFIAAEDKKFYEHPGVDFVGILRALITNITRLGSRRRPVGASTITQQVAKNFLLTNEVSIERKIKEAILAFRIERAFPKKRILELYLNEIYLGGGSYGVAAAALNYFDKSLDELSISEAAFLAGLPKAPNYYNPYVRPDAARARRDYAVGRMREDGYITAEEAEEARTGPVEVRPRTATEIARADYFVEEIRRQLVDQFGEDGVYRGGLSVRTTLAPKLQRAADRALRSGLIDYDRRHGWRGPLAKVDVDDAWEEQLGKVAVPEEFSLWRPAAVLKVTAAGTEIGFVGGETGFIPLKEMEWARKWLKDQKLGPKVTHPRQVVKRGDVVLAEPLVKPADETAKADAATEEGASQDDAEKPKNFALRQIPDIDGALVALDPHTGRVLAMSGGLRYSESQFNRATQAFRQPGSAFKPFVYLAALDNGFTPSSVILDAPVVVDQGPDRGKWKPSNYVKKFYGPSPMRLGIEKSRNLMTIRLAQKVGIDTVAFYAESFGLVDQMPRVLSMALGAGETSLIRLTTAYAMLVNGGKRITPKFIDRVQNRNGVTIFRHDNRPCDSCKNVDWEEIAPPEIPDTREQVADPRSAYQIVSMLQGVVERGTGRRVRAVGKPLAGKTGTTNDSFDTWFIGFSPDLAVGVFAGFDKPRTLGKGETGSSVAAPIFRDFMAEALKSNPAIPFRIPSGIRLVRVDATSGTLARPGDRNVILEAFKPGTEPGSRRVPTAGTASSPVVPTTNRNVRDLY